MAGKETVVGIMVDGNSLNDFIRNRPECLSELYKRAVNELTPRKIAGECFSKLRKSGNIVYIHGDNNIGLIGALSALGADFSKDYTFELLTYRKPSNWLKKRLIDEESVILYDLKYRPLTFENYDYENRRLLIAPHGLDPVLYGVRGEEDHIVYKALKDIEVKEEPSHWMIFRTNQATNAHLKMKHIASLRPYDNAIVHGKLENLRQVPGGHVIGKICDETGCIDISFYRETGRLRLTALMYEGRQVEVGGQVKPHKGKITLNAEYIRDPCTNHLYTPPLSAYHHLMKPPERALYRKTKKLQQPHRLMLPETINID
jgi:tRNA(Ile2)-agmatinylcytidine synthase